MAREVRVLNNHKSLLELYRNVVLFCDSLRVEDKFRVQRLLSAMKTQK